MNRRPGYLPGIGPVVELRADRDEPFDRETAKAIQRGDMLTLSQKGLCYGRTMGGLDETCEVLGVEASDIGTTRVRVQVRNHRGVVVTPDASLFNRPQRARLMVDRRPATL